METIAVIDFETTGRSVEGGGRATEIGVVLVRDGRVVDRYESLMNAGVSVPPFIEALTGISNTMIARAPPAAQVMREAAAFVGDLPIAAHNANFDRRFWQSELALAGCQPTDAFICTLLLSRRLFPQAPAHRLGVLGEWAGLPSTGPHHRALADAELAAHLLLRIASELTTRHRLPAVSAAMLIALQQSAWHEIDALIARWRGDPA